MALKIKKTFNTGLVAEECYVKIGRIEYSPMPSVCLIFYYTVDARTNNLSPIETRVIQLEGKEDRAAVYTYLKTLPEFEGALDI